MDVRCLADQIWVGSGVSSGVSSGVRSGSDLGHIWGQIWVSFRTVVRQSSG